MARSDSARRWPPVKGLLWGVEEGAAEDCHLWRRFFGGGVVPSCENDASSSSGFATDTAIAAGSLLVVTPGSPIGGPTRSTTSAGNRREQLRRNRAHLAEDPISPIVPRWSQRSAASRIARSSAWSWVSTRTWVPARQLRQHQLGDHRDLVRVHVGQRVGQRRQPASARWSNASRPGGGRGRGGPGSGPSRGRRGRPRRSPRTVPRPSARGARSPLPRSTGRRARTAPCPTGSP